MLALPHYAQPFPEYFIQGREGFTPRLWYMQLLLLSAESLGFHLGWGVLTVSAVPPQVDQIPAIKRTKAGGFSELKGQPGSEQELPKLSLLLWNVQVYCEGGEEAQRGGEECIK